MVFKLISQLKGQDILFFLGSWQPHAQSKQTKSTLNSNWRQRRSQLRIKINKKVVCLTLRTGQNYWGWNLTWWSGSCQRNALFVAGRSAFQDGALGSIHKFRSWSAPNPEVAILMRMAASPWWALWLLLWSSKWPERQTGTAPRGKLSPSGLFFGGWTFPHLEWPHGGPGSPVRSACRQTWRK